jgi:hypothetical protein
VNSDEYCLEVKGDMEQKKNERTTSHSLLDAPNKSIIYKKETRYSQYPDSKSFTAIISNN